MTQFGIKLYNSLIYGIVIAIENMAKGGVKPVVK